MFIANPYLINGLWIAHRTTPYNLSPKRSSLRAPRWVVGNNRTDASLEHSVESQCKCWCDWNSLHGPDSNCNGTIPGVNLSTL
jgi:hypothetical protein